LDAFEHFALGQKPEFRQSRIRIPQKAAQRRIRERKNSTSTPRPVEVRKIKRPWTNLEMRVKPLPIGFDTRKTHNEEPKYTTLNESVVEILFSLKYLTYPSLWM
jgi:hypothetical protein